MVSKSVAWRSVAAACASVALLVGAGTTASAAPGPPDEGTIVGVGRPGAIKDAYLVTLKESVGRSHIADTARGLARQHGGSVGHTYTDALRGFSVRMPEAAAKRLAGDPRVARVEVDGVVTTAETQNNPPSWGLDRIDQRDRPVDSKYTYPNSGSGVTAYVIDSGMRISHSDFGGRASYGYDFQDDDSNASDCLGHGTHVAGTVGGSKYGTAKAVKLVALRVLDCGGFGSTSTAAAAVDWLTRSATKPSVANMSLQWEKNQTLNDAITRSVSAGITFAVAAGNFNRDACEISPASTPTAITVGATDSSDTRSVWGGGQESNYGPCLDIFAPGTAINSTYHTSDTATASMSGTSMASPHVAGAAALLLSANPSWSPKQVTDKLLADSTPNKVSDPKGSANRLLYVGSGTTPPPTGPKFENTTDYAINDNATTTSPVTVSGVSGNAPSDLTVAVDIRHTYRGDLRVDLIAPDGSAYLLKNYDENDGGQNVQGSFAVNASSEAANGTWKLRASDNANQDTGYINSWSLQF